MIFPANLDVVTFHMRRRNVYKEFFVDKSEVRYDFENYYSRNSISGRRLNRFAGVRFSMTLIFDVTKDHDAIRDFYRVLYDDYVDGFSIISLYLVPESEIIDTTTFLEIQLGNLNSFLDYRNQVRRHYHQMNFFGMFAEPGIGLAYVIDDQGNLILNHEQNRVMVLLNPFT